MDERLKVHQKVEKKLKLELQSKDQHIKALQTQIVVQRFQ